MKKILFSMLVMITVLFLSTRAEAGLFTKGVDDVNGNRLIYDDDLNITWYDFSNPIDTWVNQVNWANNLTVTFNSTTFSDWRLPTTPGRIQGPVNEGEMGHLYYTELGNVANVGLSNTQDFQNLVSSFFWSGTELAPNSIIAWDFDFLNGSQNMLTKNNFGYGLAVRSGDVAAEDVEPIPEPATIALLGIGLAGLAGGAARRRRKKKAVDNSQVNI